jgi:hypothetical protein
LNIFIFFIEGSLLPYEKPKKIEITAYFDDSDDSDEWYGYYKADPSDWFYYDTDHKGIIQQYCKCCDGIRHCMKRYCD